MRPGVTRYSLARIFAWPIVFAVLSIFGLVSALLGDNLWDWLSWLTLGIPVAVIAWFWFVRARARRRPHADASFSDVAAKGSNI